MTFRALLVDDHHAWRQRIAALLSETEEWEIVGQATDGLEAAGMAATLKPDLILLDLELPTLNGLDAAARILASDPAARIVFLTGHRSWDIIEAALGGGARGYVLKAHTGSELLPAIRTVARGGRFVSHILGGRGVGGDAPDPAPRFHEATFYQHEQTLLDAYEHFATTAFAARKVVIGLVSTARFRELNRRLEARGVDVERAIREDRYIALGVPEALSLVMVDDRLDDTRFWKNGWALMMRAARAANQPRPAVAAFGDASDTLWKAGRLDAAIHFEEMWDELARTFDLDILCGFSVHGTDLMADDAHRRICAAHITHTR